MAVTPVQVKENEKEVKKEIVEKRKRGSQRRVRM